MTQPYGVDTDRQDMQVEMIKEEEERRAEAEIQENLVSREEALESFQRGKPQQKEQQPESTGNVLGDAIKDTATKDPKDFDAGNNAVEFMNTMSDGVLSIVEDVPTLPERLFDSITGEEGR